MAAYYNEIDRLPAACGIYEIVNQWNGKAYIGSSVNILVRSYAHKAHLRTGTHTNDKIQADWSELGEASFLFLVVELVDDPRLLRGIEEAHILRRMPNCYNHSATGGRKDKIDPRIAVARANIPRRVTKKVAPTN